MNKMISGPGLTGCVEDGSGGVREGDMINGRFVLPLVPIHGGHMNATVATVASVVTHVPIPNSPYLSS